MAVAAEAVPPTRIAASSGAAVRRRSGPYARAVAEAETQEHRLRIEATFRRHYRALVNIIRERSADPNRNEDLVQETLVRALRYAHTLDPARPVMPWLRSIAARVVVDDAARAATQRETIIDLTDTDDLVDADFSDALFEAHPGLTEAFSNLPAVQQTVLRLRFLEDWSGNDTARFMGVTRAACDQLVCRAKRRLLDELDALGAKYPALAPLAGGGFFARMRMAVAQRRAGVTGWDATLTSLGAVAENMAVALALTVAGVTLPGVAAAVEFGLGFGSDASAPVAEATTAEVVTISPAHADAARTGLSAVTESAPIDDGSSIRSYSLRPTDDVGVADAPPTAADAVLAEDDRRASVLVDVQVEFSAVGVGYAGDASYELPCDSESATASATCDAVDVAIDASNGDS